MYYKEVECIFDHFPKYLVKILFRDLNSKRVFTRVVTIVGCTAPPRGALEVDPFGALFACLRLK
jgi:hypothetical protein